MPRIIPALVIVAGEVIVGDIDRFVDESPAGSIAFARPKSSTFTVAVGADLDVGRLEIAMNDALLVCRFEGLGNLLRDGQRLIDLDRATGNPLREILAFDEFHYEREDAGALFESVDARQYCGWFRDASTSASR